MLDAHDRALASPRLRRLALHTPLTRWIANRRTRALFDLTAGFAYTQTLDACVRLGLFERLRHGPRTVAELAPDLGLTPPATARLCAAACGLRLLRRRAAGRYGLGALGCALIDNPGLVAMIEHHAPLYDDLRDTVGLLRGTGQPTRMGRYWGYARAARPADLPADEVAAYSALMAASQDFIAASVLDAYDMRRHRTLLDVGGGEGAFLRTAAARHADLRLVLFDLPAVAARAALRFAEAGLSERARSVGGDFTREPLPQGADLISLVRVVHDHDDAVAQALLRAVFAALPPGGTLLLAEPMADTAGAEPVGTYFELYLLAMGRGRPRTVEELRAMLAAAGFRDCRLLSSHQPLLARVLTARRPA